MKNVLALALISGGILAQPAHAAIDPNIWVTVEGGRDFAIQTTQTNTLSMPDSNLPDDYLLNNINNNWMAGVGVGYEFVRHSQLFPTAGDEWFPVDRVGVFYDYYSPKQVSGVINEYQSITAYNDHFSVHSNTLWLDNQLDLIHLHAFTPFIDLGIGAARNTASGYFEQPVAANDSPRADSAAFGSNSNWALAYRAGFGVDYVLPTKQPMDIGLMYRYTDLGRAKTGNSATYPIGSISSGRLKSNEVSLALRYYF